MTGCENRIRVPAAAELDFSRMMVECAEDMMEMVFRGSAENDLAAAFGLTSGQERVVRTVARLNRAEPEGVALKDLAAALGLSSGATSIIVYSIITKGALCRQQSEEDRRKVRITLSPEAKRLLDAASAGMAEITAEIVKDMGGGMPEGIGEFLAEFSRRVSLRSRGDRKASDRPVQR